MQAIILAGGRGTRLWPLTEETPKPLLACGGAPFMAHQLRALANSGVHTIVVSAGYRSQEILAFVRTVDLPVDIRVVVEGTPLGTGGAVGLAAGSLSRADEDEPVAVVNGDTYFSHDIAEQAAVLVEHKADAVVLAVPVHDQSRYGSLAIDPSDIVRALSEKRESGPGVVNGGVYVFRRSALPNDSVAPASLEEEILPPLVAQRRVRAFECQGTWADIGTVESLIATSARLILEATSATQDAAFSVDASAVLDETVRLGGGAYVAAGCRCRAGSVILGSVLSHSSIVGRAARIEDSYLGANVVIGDEARIRGAVVGDGTVVGTGEYLAPGTVLPPRWHGSHGGGLL